MCCTDVPEHVYDDGYYSSNTTEALHTSGLEKDGEDQEWVNMFDVPEGDMSREGDESPGSRNAAANASANLLNGRDHSLVQTCTRQKMC